MTAPALEAARRERLDRADAVARLAELGFGWADLEQEEYWLDEVVAMDADVYERLERAASSLWAIFDRTVRYMHGRRELYALIGIPPILWNMLDGLELPPPGQISRYARFDFAVGLDGGIKLLELNADTPTGYAEAAAATPWLCRQAGLRSPNEAMAQRLAAAWSEERPDAVACAAYGSHAEDTGTIDLLARHSGLELRKLDLLDLSVEHGVVLDGDGVPIRRMFALYPKEWMALDDGGEALAYAIETGQLTLFNSPHAILLQSKGLQALVWGLHELGMLYGEQEREAIEAYLLPTYTKPLFDGSYVSKSMFGREGGSVKLYGEGGGLEIEDKDGFDTSVFFPTVYQRRADLPELELGGSSYRLLTGLFMLGGEPCGLLGRAGGLITGNTSHFVPIGVKER
ncbi:glutathionylspermidine synthase family protein [Paenibacillus albicereus]|uniref:Glutathionylspermidine synthase family protein n=1 Tax=Paenibacillus albicereus TaxID=2726185 RepID=A0A6H2GXM4_9BACL|nr:glutathionylspermidine synthase family protein [Paenibacillus albicereus]QJC52155.1 glutathionylspermidine synthase family protein [Paenibacillus albicereus]